MADENVTFDILARDRASNTFKKVGRETDSLSRKLGGVARVARLAVTAFAGGAVVRAIANVGMAYQDSLNVFQAVTHSTGAEMDRVAAKAKELGANLTLPTTSAADAAASMTELAKGGLSVRQSMDAALGTLQLAAAAQIDGAQAAEIQSAALNQFRLKGKDAAHVADLLANTANAAAGEITDMATAMTYVGPVAHAVGISIDDTSTAIGLLAKNGILGSKAGTGLRGMLVSLESPSEKASTGLKRLGIEAFDSQGNFVGLRKIIDELSDAQGRLTTKQFTSAAAMAFGRTPLAAVNALAAEGATNFDKMSKAVGREGGAADVAKAKTRGLRGALSGLQSQLETIAISIYEKVAPGVEKGVRLISERLIPALSKGFDKAKVALFGREVNTLLEHQLGTGGPINPHIGFIPQIVAAITTAVQDGDFSAVGKAIGDAFVKTVTTTANLALQVTAAFGHVLAQVDWVQLGLDVGRATLPFVAGVATGIINYIGSGSMLHDIAGHWQDLLFAVIAVAFTPGKVIGAVANALRRIPFAGRLIAWAFEAFAKFSKAIVGFVGRALGRMGDAFLRGLGIEGRKVVSGFVDRVILPIYVHVDDWVKFGVRLVRGLGNGIIRGIEGVGRQVAKIIKALLKPFANAGKWLIQAGREVITGFINGIKSKASELKDAVTGTAGNVGGWFKDKLHIHSPSKVFHEIGVDTLKGLINGLESMRDRVRDKVQRVAEMLTSLRSNARALAADIKGSLTGAFDVANAPNLSASGIQSFLGAGAKQTEHFVRQLHQLIKLGYSPALVQQIAAMGVGPGTAAARNLIHATAAQRHHINALEHKLQLAGGQAGQLVAQQQYGEKIDKTNAKLERVVAELAKLRHEIHGVKQEIHGAQHKSTARP